MLRKKSGQRPENFLVLAFKIAWATLRTRSKSMVFAKEIMFPKRRISKISRLRRATLPATFNLYSGRAPPSQACFQIYRRLSRSLHVHKTFLQTGWPAKTWLCHIYGRLPCSLHMHKTRLQSVIGTRQKRCHIWFTGGYGALYTCMYAQNAYTKKCVGRKMRRRREKIEIQELKRQFLVLKTWKIYQITVKNSSKIAPKARNFLGYFGDFWRKHVFASDPPPPCSTLFSNKGGGR